MESLHKLEDMVEKWLKPLPHLPENWRKWLAENAWWLTLIGVILSVIGIFLLLGPLLFVTAVTTSVYGVVVAETHTGLYMLAIWVSLALLVVVTIIEAFAISPLKALSKKGWDLLFLALVIEVVSSLVSAVLNISIMSLISAAISAIIGAYVLFEVRSHYKKA
jgi:hypothetical protein